MSKQRLLNVINSDTISSEDLTALKAIARNHPYSQIIHSLIAKGAYQNADKSAQSSLHIAAMYATDRQVLKSLISQSKSVKPQVKKKTVIKVQQADRIADKSKSKFTTDFEISDGAKLREEVLHNLELLMESKKPYSSDEFQNITAITKKKKASSKKKAQAVNITSTVEQEKPVVKVKKEKSTEKAKKELKKTSKSKDKSKTKKEKSGEEKPKKPKVIEQIALIDEFIKKQPSITVAKGKSNEPTKDQEDLSRPSADFGEDLISENLAEILISQGKKDKAIDIYKKLIWKFPQKKAYFATQIEELKK